MPKRARRSKKTITYHGRSGRPVIHKTATGKRYIMVRKRGGGVRRLYEGSKYSLDGTRVKLKILKL